MTDAKRSLGEIIGSNYGEIQVHRETMQDAAEALKKQIPRKPDMTTTTFHGISGISETEDWVPMQEECYECPVCGGFLGYVVDCEDEYYQCNYCSSCGQAIDWGEGRRKEGNESKKKHESGLQKEGDRVLRDNMQELREHGES